MRHTALALFTMGALAALTSCGEEKDFSETEGVPSCNPAAFLATVNQADSQYHPPVGMEFAMLDCRAGLMPEKSSAAVAA